MTDERAAEILREIARQNLPTVNGIPFPEIREALTLAAARIDITENKQEERKNA